MKQMIITLCLIASLMFPVSGIPQNDTDENTREIQIGAVLPLDGQWASTGKDSNAALSLAAGTVNDYLKPYHLILNLNVENSSSDPQKALAALKKLHDMGVKVVIGPCTSAEADAMVSYADQNGMLLLSPSSTALSLARDDNLFRLVPNDENQAEGLALMIQHQNISQILIVYMNDPYGSGMCENLKKMASNSAFGFQVTGTVSFDPSITDFTPLVRNITSAAADVKTDTGAIVFIGSDSDAIGVFTTAGSQSPLSDYKWFSGDGVIREAAILQNSTAAEFAAKTRLEGLSFACEDTVTMVPTMMAAGLLSEKLGTSPSPAVLPIWDAIWLIGETYQLNPDADSDTLKSNLVSVSNVNANVFNELSTFDSNGDPVFAKYARFMALKDISGGVYWNLVGMFIKNKTIGAFVTDATNNVTHESGTIVIGAVLPLTGADREIGTGAREAINLASHDSNSYFTTTESLNIRFSFDIRDSASDPETALKQVRDLHEAGTNIIILGGPSVELAAVREYAKENNIIILSTRSTAVSLSRTDDLIYRLSPDDTNQAKALVRLIEKQGKTNLVVLYRDDVYGRDLQKALSEQFNGSMDAYRYPVNETDFSSLLEKATLAVEKENSNQDTAIVVIGLEEITQLLETVKNGPLTSVSWYGTDGIAQSRSLLSSPEAVSVSEKTNFTASTYDAGAQKILTPMYHVAVQSLSRAVNGTAGWNEISGYDAAWMAMNAYALTSPHANSRDLWEIINNRYGAAGVGGIYMVNNAHDQSLSSYTFYTVKNTPAGPVWVKAAFYRDVMTARDDLQMIVS